MTSGLAAQLDTWEHIGQGSSFSERLEEIRSRSKMRLSQDQLLAQNFDAVLAVIVKLAGDTIFAKFCQDALSHTVRHPSSIQTWDVVGMGWDGLVWVEMDGDGWETVWRGVWDQFGWVTGRELWPRNGFVHLPASFFRF